MHPMHQMYPRAPQRPSDWWREHVRHTREYVDAVKAGDAAKAQDAVRGLLNGVIAWGDIAQSDLAVALMAEHTIIAKNLVDSLARGLKDGEGDLLVEYFTRNADAQTDLYRKTVPGFDADAWHRLFMGHIEPTGKYIIELYQGDQKASDEDFARVLENMRQIGAFSDAQFR